VKRKSRTAARPFRPYALTWIDFLVMGAIALTFIAIATSTISHAKASSVTKASAYNDPPTFSTETGRSVSDADLIKARIRLAAGGPWN
jgi:hypothetical protein